ncbi:MAG: cyclic nucleotide-binding domain-containing protein [bacterium]|nr:cyclic nucleotide-binding domain-containing protein [bacterium]
MKKIDSKLSEQELADFIQSTGNFDLFSEQSIRYFSSNLEHVFLSKGKALFKQGEQGDAMFIMLSGLLQAVYTNDKGRDSVMGEIGPGMPVGEMQVLAGGDHTAGIYALADSELLKMPRPVFERIADEFPPVLHELAEIVRQRLRHNQLLTMLLKLFGEIDKTTLQNLEKQLRWVHLQPGEALFHQGEPGESLFLVISGRLQVIYDDDDGTRVIIGEIGRGETIGEMSVLMNEGRTANVYATRESYLVKFIKPVFQQMTKDIPEVMVKISQLLINRLRRATGSIPPTKNEINYAVIPASPDVPIVEFTRRFVDALSEYGPTMILSSGGLNEMMGMKDIAQTSADSPYGIRLAAWLDEQESRYSSIVYESDSTMTPWSHRCIRMADHVIVVANADSEPVMGDIEKELYNPDGEVKIFSKTLVLLHPNNCELPSGTDRWLQKRKVDNHHHIRINWEEDYNRLARLISGNSIGLVLSGGGARGFAHIGVIRALEEAGIPIDVVGGTSMGATIGASYAIGHHYRDMLQSVKKRFIDPRSLKEYTLPIVSILRGRKLEKNIRLEHGETLLEDFWINFYCVSSNLTTSEMCVHRRGFTWKALRATSALPGIVPPVVRNNNLLVDGGAINNLPGDVMKELYGGFIIAVDVSNQSDLRVMYKKFPSPWRILASWLIPFKKRIDVPTIKDLLVQSTMLSSVQKKKMVKREADIYLQPPVDRFNVMDMEAYEDIAEAGYQYAKEKIAEWLQQKEQDDDSLLSIVKDNIHIRRKE